MKKILLPICLSFADSIIVYFINFSHTDFMSLKLNYISFKCFLALGNKKNTCESMKKIRQIILNY